MSANAQDPLFAKVDNIADQLRELRRDIKYRRVGVWTIGWGVFVGMLLWTIITAVAGWLIMMFIAGAALAAWGGGPKPAPQAAPPYTAPAR